MAYAKGPLPRSKNGVLPLHTYRGSNRFEVGLGINPSTAQAEMLRTLHAGENGMELTFSYSASVLIVKMMRLKSSISTTIIAYHPCIDYLCFLLSTIILLLPSIIHLPPSSISLHLPSSLSISLHPSSSISLFLYSLFLYSLSFYLSLISL